MRYFNNQSQPNDVLDRRVSITIPEVSAFDTDVALKNRTFSPCQIAVVVNNIPDPVVVNLPDG